MTDKPKRSPPITDEPQTSSSEEARRPDSLDTLNMDAVTRTLRPSRSLLRSLYPTRRCYHRGLAPVASLATATIRPALQLRPSPASPPRRSTQPPTLTTRSSSTQSSSPAPKFADGVDVATAREGVDALCEQGWVLDGDGAGLKKTFYFRSYFKAVVGFSFFLLLLLSFISVFPCCGGS